MCESSKSATRNEQTISLFRVPFIHRENNNPARWRPFPVVSAYLPSWLFCCWPAAQADAHCPRVRGRGAAAAGAHGLPWALTRLTPSVSSCCCCCACPQQPVRPWPSRSRQETTLRPRPLPLPPRQVVARHRLLHRPWRAHPRKVSPAPLPPIRGWRNWPAWALSDRESLLPATHRTAWFHTSCFRTQSCLPHTTPDSSAPAAAALCRALHPPCHSLTDRKGAAQAASTAIASAASSGNTQAVASALAEAVSTGGAATAGAFAEAIADSVGKGQGDAAASVRVCCQHTNSVCLQHAVGLFLPPFPGLLHSVVSSEELASTALCAPTLPTQPCTHVCVAGPGLSSRLRQWPGSCRADHRRGLLFGGRNSHSHSRGHRTSLQQEQGWCQPGAGVCTRLCKLGWWQDRRRGFCRR